MARGPVARAPVARAPVARAPVACVNVVTLGHGPPSTKQLSSQLTSLIFTQVSSVMGNTQEEHLAGY